MDELVAIGTAGIIALVGAAVLIFSGICLLLTAAVTAAESGNDSLLYSVIIFSVALVAGYVATGLWLRKRDII